MSSVDTDNITWLDQRKNVQFVDTDNITWLDQRKNVQFVDTDNITWLDQRKNVQFTDKVLLIHNLNVKIMLYKIILISVSMK